jgi:hypothetical protein
VSTEALEKGLAAARATAAAVLGSGGPYEIAVEAARGSLKRAAINV